MKEGAGGDKRRFGGRRRRRAGARSAKRRLVRLIPNVRLAMIHMSDTSEALTSEQTAAFEMSKVFT